MKEYTLEKDILVFYITAGSFPDGVLTAHKTLHAMIPFSTSRKYFGISFPNEQGTIIYKAAAEELEAGEAEKLKLETSILKKGTYISEVIENYHTDIPGIGRTFQQLLSDPRIDPQGACVEWYLNDRDVQCMIRLA